jgi:ribosomal protein L12E/L44/L45/RPP1/RPP2
MSKTLATLITALFAAVTFNAQAGSHAGGAPMKASEPAGKASAAAAKDKAAAKKEEKKEVKKEEAKK